MNEESSDRWPHIRHALHVDSAGNVDADFIGWWWKTSDTLSAADRAAAYEQWADFYEYRLAQRADELAGDHSLRHLVERWTDSMAYCCRRSAAWARDEDPGPAIPQHERRPDLCGLVRTVLDAEDGHHADRQLVHSGSLRGVAGFG